jgi:hypothetical protein
MASGTRAENWSPKFGKSEIGGQAGGMNWRAEARGSNQKEARQSNHKKGSGWTVEPGGGWVIKPQGKRLDSQTRMRLDGQTTRSEAGGPRTK